MQGKQKEVYLIETLMNMASTIFIYSNNIICCQKNNYNSWNRKFLVFTFVLNFDQSKYGISPSCLCFSVYCIVGIFCGINFCGCSRIRFSTGQEICTWQVIQVACPLAMGDAIPCSAALFPILAFCSGISLSYDPLFCSCHIAIGDGCNSPQSWQQCFKSGPRGSGT